MARASNRTSARRGSGADKKDDAPSGEGGQTSDPNAGGQQGGDAAAAAAGSSSSAGVAVDASVAPPTGSPAPTSSASAAIPPASSAAVAAAVDETANGGGGAAAAAEDRPRPSEESLVLAYLRKYGLGDAAAELHEILQKEQQDASKTQAAGAGAGDAKKRKRGDGGDSMSGDGGGDGRRKKLPPIDYDVEEDGMELDDVAGASPAAASGAGAGAGGGSGPEGERPQSTLAAATGGGFGYDLDAAPTIALWGAGSAPPSLRNRKLSRLLLEGRDLDNVNANEGRGGGGGATRVGGAKSDKKGKKKKDEEEEEMEAMVNFRDEARRYIEGFTSLVTWILTLPDDPANPIVSPMTTGRPPFSGPMKAGDPKKGGAATRAVEDGDGEIMQVGDSKGESDAGDGPHEGLANLVGHALAAAEFDATRPRPPAPRTLSLPLGATAVIPAASSVVHDPLLLPSSSKPELLSLSFPLLVHTYCELLTCGLEHTALALLDTYRHLYEPVHRNEIADLDKCNSLGTIVQLNDDVIAQSVVHSEMRMINGQCGLIQRKIAELEGEAAALRCVGNNKRNADEEKKLAETSRKLAKYNDSLSRHGQKLEELNVRNDALTSKLLALPFLRRARALKWNITVSTSSFAALTGFVSSRDELLPMSALLQSRCHLIVERRDPLPFCPPAVLEDLDGSGAANGVDGEKAEGGRGRVRWAAPVHPEARAIEAGEDASRARSILTRSEALPFPKIGMEDGDDDKDAGTRAAVEFNRALLVNGFRRLEALELKREYESGLLPPSSEKGGGVPEKRRQIHVADPLRPSVLMATLCSSSTTLTEADAGAGPAAAPWVEPNIGITSASICPPDGRRVAVGCDDAAVRIWSLDRPVGGDGGRDPSTGSTLGEPSAVLLGHKNGFPVFDVDWTRDGRTLLSAGGDGTVRLWDAAAVGPYGRLSNVMQQKNNVSHTVGGPASTSLSTVAVPGSRAESLVEVGGAALSVYRGHVPSTPIWSVSSAPCGYYFASAGGDYTARIWTTDRTSPVRILSGHVSPAVNCVAWHPNCNYVLTASDDKTCRMFDIQTGRCVRLLSGSSRGLNLVRVSPSGRYAAGAAYDGVVRLWDLGDGRLINELRPPAQKSGYSEGMVHSMSFSSCGSALAVAGEDCAMRIWDVRGAGNHLSNPEYFAATCGVGATSSLGSGLTAAQISRMPENERSRPGTRVPAKTFMTNGVSVMDLKFTKRNLLLAVGNY